MLVFEQQISRIILLPLVLCSLAKPDSIFEGFIILKPCSEFISIMYCFEGVYIK